MKTVNVHSAKTHLSRLLREVAKGEEIILARGGEPIAKLSPLKPVKRPRQLGFARGKVKISADFDEPLEDFAEYS